MADRDVEVDILATDKTAAATVAAARNFERLRADARKANTDMTAGSLRFAKSMAAATLAVGKAVSTVAALASLAGPATAGLVGLGKAIASVGKAVGGLGALGAFLPSLAGSVGLVVATAKLLLPAFAETLNLIKRLFFDAEGAATNLTQALRGRAVRGVAELTAQFRDLNMPFIIAAMARMATATNTVAVGFGQWANSVEGQQLVRAISVATADAFERLAPKVTAAAVAVGRLANRAGDRAIVGFADLVGRILDKFTAWADGTSMKDISNALKDLSGWFGVIREKFGAIRDMGRWLGENEGQVRRFATAVGVLGLALGALTGNPFAIIASSFSLIVTNWGSAKGALGEIGPFFARVWSGIRNDPNVRGIFDSIKAAWSGFVDSFTKQTATIGPKFKELTTQLKNAWAEWGPVIKAWWDGVGKPALSAFGTLLGFTLMQVIEKGAVAAEGFAIVGRALRAFVNAALSHFGALINGAAHAFGWIPGIGPKLERAAADFNAFRDRVNGALSGIHDRTATVTVRVATVGKLPGGVSVGEGNTRPITGAFSGVGSWRPGLFAEQFAAGTRAGAGANFAAAGAGGSRTGGPSEVNVTSVINLDGRPFREFTAKAIDESERRNAWRGAVGKR